MNAHSRLPVALIVVSATLAFPASADVGVGAKPLSGAEVIIDGTRQTLDEKWIYWEGPGFKSAMPIKWQIVDDPVDKGSALMTDAVSYTHLRAHETPEH